MAFIHDKATVRGSGAPGTAVGTITSVIAHTAGPITLISAGPFELSVVRRVGSAVPGSHTLTGRWDGGQGVLAGVTSRG